LRGWFQVLRRFWFSSESSFVGKADTEGQTDVNLEQKTPKCGDFCRKPTSICHSVGEKMNYIRNVQLENIITSEPAKLLDMSFGILSVDLRGWSNACCP
jgi:hypothetical protein